MSHKPSLFVQSRQQTGGASYAYIWQMENELTRMVGWVELDNDGANRFKPDPFNLPTRRICY